MDAIEAYEQISEEIAQEIEGVDLETLDENEVCELAIRLTKNSDEAR